MGKTQKKKKNAWRARRAGALAAALFLQAPSPQADSTRTVGINLKYETW